MKRLLVLGGWAVAGVATIPQMICGLGGQATGPPAPGDGRAGVVAQANDDQGARVKARDGRRTAGVRLDSSSSPADLVPLNARRGAGGGGGSGGDGGQGGCVNQGLQVSGDSDADGNVRESDPDADGTGVADANIGPRCEPGIGADLDGSGDVDS